ncbi:tape measure protein [Chryseobacterium indoltheticum]|uniref:Tape measure domain n=1 Tax=Chryseobacterium indoltheticum TaxID=254 RepID=A0A381FAD8_9FLAO|nr:tape measure protein [Chryseobacterium indoltheticum]AZA73578.1 hypothetical protein EG358_07330 [Chryseobacterium indoltheticum]SIR23849.1 tape measure domain-containing protein [Chryseobacterium indoltheticum]SUX43546.1 tape measure domain [Chryseobacterium indoltheticum]
MADRLAVIQAQESIDELKRVEDSIKSVIKTTKDLIKNANNISKALKTGTPREYTRALREMNTATKEFNKSQVAMANNMTRITRLERQVAQMLREQSRAIREVANATRDESRAREAAERIATQQQRTARETANAQAAENRANREAANALNAESRARQQATREQRQNERQTRESTSAHARLTREVREARNRARDYGAEMVDLTRAYRNGDVAQREYRQRLAQLSRDFRNANRESIDLQRQLTRLNRSTTPGVHGSLPGRVTDILKAAGVVGLVDNIASSFYRLGEKALETSIKLDSLRLAQNSVFKTQDNVAKQNEFLTGIADRYGIEILGLTDAYTKFAASAQGTYLEGTQTQNIFDAVTRSSSLLGVSTDETTGILRALGQMMSKGKVQAEELRGQLGDRMAGAFKLFADGMGVSTAQLDKMLKDGEVLADDVLPKFADQLNKKYKLDLGDQIDTQTASINRRTNAWVAFVDGVNSGSGVMTKSVLGFNAVLTNMLEALTPSKKVTIIEQEQAQLNLLGIELRKNFNDQKKKKEIIEQIVALNPYFLNGLDKEKSTLSEISIQLQNVNYQYVQKIILEKQQEKINDLLKDQAQALIYIGRVYSDNAVEYNNLNDEAKKAIDDFRDGVITYSQATSIVRKSTKDFTEENTNALDILYQLDNIINVGTLNFDGYNRGVKGNEKAIKSASKEYNNIIEATNMLIGTQGQLVNSNGLLSLSFDETGRAMRNRRIYFDEILGQAERQGKKFALINNVFRENVNGKWITTTKKETEGWFIDEKGILKQREKTKLLEKDEKKKASSLSSIQKDHLKDLQAIRDTMLAKNETSFEKEKISEIKYLDEILRINTEFYNKKMGYLKGKNAEERKQIADADLDQAKLVKSISAKKTEISKKAFENEAKVLEENYKIQSNILERNSEDLENISFVSGVARIDRQIEIDTESIQKAEEYHKELIRLAKNANQETIDLERKRDEEIGQLEDKRSERFRSRYEAALEDLNVQSEFAQGFQNLTYEQQKSVILANKKLTISEREFQLNILEKNNQIEVNKIEIERLKTLRSQLLTKIAASQVAGIINPNDVQEVEKLEGLIKGLENINIQIEIDTKNDIDEKTKAIQDTISKGFDDLGFEGLASSYRALMVRLKGDTASWKDYAVLAASAVLDAMSDLTDKQKEKRIAALDEELKISQETTEQELGFINGRLNALNSLEELTAEQMSERNRLEDEARTYKEQQYQREKLIEAQKARAEQKAAAQKALINGALAATMTLAQLGFIAGAIPAALALGFGIAQSVAIMAKDPVPKYRVGRKGGNAEVAITQDGGREFISNEKGEITSLGSDKGDQLTYLKKGDNVHTAKETKAIINRIGSIPKLGDNIFHKIALQSLRAPAPVVINQNVDYSEKIADLIAKKFDSTFKRYTHDTVIKENGKIYKQRGANYPELIGYYDLETGNEIIKQDDTN